MAGITSTGLETKRLNQVREDLRLEANQIFSDLVPTGDVLDTGSGSTLGRLIGVVSLGEAELWEAIQEVYSAFDPNSAEGIALDNLVSLAGIVRKGATPTTARVAFEADAGTTIPAGSIVSSSFTNNRFETSEEIVMDSNTVIGVTVGVQSVIEGDTYQLTYQDSNNTISVDYVAQAGDTALDILSALSTKVNDNIGTLLTSTIEGNTVRVEADNLISEANYSLTNNLYFVKILKGTTVASTELGPIDQAVGTIDTISTPVLGWDSVRQITQALIGSFRETDAQLRGRFVEAKYTRGSNILDSLQSQLRNLDGVQDTKIYENLTPVQDANGLPPHSFRVLIRGGLDQEIGETIWRNRPAGISTSGNVTVFLKDITGNTKEVYLQRPQFVDIYVSVSVTTDDDFPPDGIEQIRSAIFAYVRDNAKVGDGFKYTRFYTPVNSVPGHYVNDLFIGTSANPTGTSNISINFDELVKLEFGNIEVTTL